MIFIWIVLLVTTGTGNCSNGIVSKARVSMKQKYSFAIGKFALFVLVWLSSHFKILSPHRETT